MIDGFVQQNQEQTIDFEVDFKFQFSKAPPNWIVYYLAKGPELIEKLSETDALNEYKKLIIGKKIKAKILSVDGNHC